VVLSTWPGSSPSCRSPVVEVPAGSNIRIAPPGEDGLCSVPRGDDEGVALAQDDRVLGFAVAQVDLELAVEDEEELVGVLVHVPHVLAGGVGDLDVVVVHPGHDPRAVDLVEGRQCRGEVHGFRLHATILGGPS
jgi:hypothetical protein